jgi:hypothetical protein
MTSLSPSSLKPAIDHQRLFAFLKRYETIWGHSILQNWPRSRVHFPSDWLKSVARLSPERLHAFTNGEAASDLHNDLQTLLAEAQSFELIVSGEEMPLDPIEAQGLNEKKQHEARRLLPVLAQLGSELTGAVDIGGGVGHIARLCVKRFGWRFHSIDQDQTLHAKAEWWLKRSRGFDRSKLSFVTACVSDDSDELDALFSHPQTLSLGLHTCGSLAHAQFRKSLKSDLIVNFGCCFDKTRPHDLNLSTHAKQHPIAWNSASLFLATRGRSSLDATEFALLRRVNDHRFALHLLLQISHPEKGFLIAGDAPKSLYQQPFATYANDRLAKLGLSQRPKDELEDFYRKAQGEVLEIFAAHCIRAIFARPLELLILSDRALWLQEKGLHAELRAVFDRDLSPRNIAIIARRSGPYGTSP